MMNTRQPYKGFIVEARPYELKEGGWRAEIYVENHEQEGVLVTQFYLDQTLATKEQAIQAGIEAGRVAIDKGFEPTVSSQY